MIRLSPYQTEILRALRTDAKPGDWVDIDPPYRANSLRVLIREGLIETRGTEMRLTAGGCLVRLARHEEAGA